MGNADIVPPEPGVSTSIGGQTPFLEQDASMPKRPLPGDTQLPGYLPPRRAPGAQDEEFTRDPLPPAEPLPAIGSPVVSLSPADNYFGPLPHWPCGMYQTVISPRNAFRSIYRCL